MSPFGRKVGATRVALQCAGILLGIGCWVAPAEAGTIDVVLRLVSLPAPSPVSNVSIPEDQLKSLLGHVVSFDPLDTFYVELWVSDVGSLNTGMTGFFADLSFNQSLVRGDALFHTPGSFGLLPSGTIDNTAGLIRNFGGNDSTLSGQGIAPVWSRVGYVQMFALGAGVTAIESSLGLGGLGVLGRLPPPESEVQFDSISISTPEPAAATLLAAAVFAMTATRQRSRINS